MLTTNSLWVLGLSILLSALSYHDWLARTTNRRFRQMMALPSWRRAFSTGMFLTCLGWGVAQANDRWEQLLWIIVAISFGGASIRNLVGNRHRNRTERPPAV